MLKSRTKNAGIIEAIKELKAMSLTDRIRMEYELRLKAKRDRRAEDEFVFEQGREDGLKQGREDGVKALINALHRNGYTDEQIMEELMTEYRMSREEAQEKLK